MEEIKEKELLYDFCYLEGENKNSLSKFERLSLLGIRAIDKALNLLINRESNLIYYNLIETFNFQQAKKALNYYYSDKILSNPLTQFYLNNPPPKFIQTKVHTLQDGVVLDITFKSNFKSKVLSYSQLLNNEKSITTTYARWWRHNKTPKGTILAIHGWTMGDQRINSLAFTPGYFYNKGLDIVLIELPFHGRRKHSNEKILFPNGDIFLTNEAISQSVSDIFATYNILTKLDAPNISIVGISLGGYISALCSSIHPFHKVVLLSPLVSMAETAWNIIAQFGKTKEFIQNGFSLNQFKKAYFFHSPLNYQLRTNKENIFIIAGIGDKIIPSSQPHCLWRHFHKPKLKWFSGGHLGLLKKENLREEIYRFITS